MNGTKFKKGELAILQQSNGMGQLNTLVARIVGKGGAFFGMFLFLPHFLMTTYALFCVNMIDFMEVAVRVVHEEREEHRLPDQVYRVTQALVQLLPYPADPTGLKAPRTVKLADYIGAAADAAAPRVFVTPRRLVGHAVVMPRFKDRSLELAAEAAFYETRK